jgi:hypothetical protein
MKKYKVRLLPGHSAQTDQIKDGCLAFCNQVQTYGQFEARKKAKSFGGKAEPITTSLVGITFAVNGSVSQELEMLTGEDPVTVLKKIQDGTYLVSISTKEIHELPSFEVVGHIISQDTLEDTEYSDFELTED